VLRARAVHKRRNRGVAAAAVAAISIATTAILTAGPAFATGPDCTFTDTTHSATADSLTNPVLAVTAGDSVIASCTGLVASTTVATSIATAGAGLVSGLANQEAFTDISKAVIGSASSSGTFSTTYTVWSATLANGSACGPTAAQVNAGLACTLAVASLTGTSFGSVSLIYSGQPAPAGPTLTTDQSSYSPGDTVTLSGSGFFGAPVTGTPKTGANVAAPTLSLDGTVLSNALTTTAATWPTASTNSLTPGGVLGGDLTVSLPGTIATGTHTLTVVQPNATAYSGPAGSAAGTVKQSVTFTVGASTPAASLTCSPTSGSVGTTVDLTGSKWPPNATVSVAFTDGSPASVGTATIDASGQLTGSITVAGTDRVESSNPIAVHDGADNLTTSCAFGVTRLSPLSQRIKVRVKPGKLSDSQIAGSATTVTLTPIKLTGTAQHGAGAIKQAMVMDARGALVGWTLTGTMTGNFTASIPRGKVSRHVIPAGALLITPSVLAVTGLQSEVAAGVTQRANHITGQTLASAAAGGGGGAFRVNALLHLKVPARVAPGRYFDRLVITLA
jgi:hypothetical protein